MVQSGPKWCKVVQSDAKWCKVPVRARCAIYICPYDTVSCCCRLTTRRRDVVLFISWLSPISMMQNLQKNLPKLGFWSFFTFFRRKPPSGHGLSWHTKFNPILLVVSEEIGVRRTDRRTDRFWNLHHFDMPCWRTNPLRGLIKFHSHLLYKTQSKQSQ